LIYFKKVKINCSNVLTRSAKKLKILTFYTNTALW